MIFDEKSQTNHGGYCFSPRKLICCFIPDIPFDFPDINECIAACAFCAV